MPKDLNIRTKSKVGSLIHVSVRSKLLKCRVSGSSDIEMDTKMPALLKLTFKQQSLIQLSMHA